MARSVYDAGAQAPLMECGHTANAHCRSLPGEELEAPVWSCAICSCLDVVSVTPDLTGRTAICSYRQGYGGCRGRANNSHRQCRGPSAEDCYGEMREDGMSVAPSASDLPFFEFRGEGSPMSRRQCANCQFYESAHKDNPRAGRKGYPCRDFKAHGPYEFDRFYCGCMGWS